MAAVFAATSASAGSTSVAATAQKCGEDVVYPAKDPDGAFKKLPKDIQARYGPYPYEIKATPWEAFKGKPKPWKIGLITFPVGSPWLADVIKQVGTEFNKAKAKGLVEGTLQKYIQPSYATATPEQQIAAIQQMVRDGIDGILLLPLAGPPLAPAIDAAGKAGVPVVILDNVVSDAKYAVNVWSQNNSPAAAGRCRPRQDRQRAVRPRHRRQSGRAGVPGRGCGRRQGVPRSQDRRHHLRQVDECDGQGRDCEVARRAPRHEDRRRDPERHHDGRHRAGVPADRPPGAADQRRRLSGR